MSPEHPQTCIYPGCERPVVGPHTLGGPPSAFCDLEEHNALSAHQQRQHLAREAGEHSPHREAGEHSRHRARGDDDEEVDRGR